MANQADAQETRRLACDRCRSQKLKCVRTELHETCQRCRTAKTACSFGRPLPPGRPPSVRTSTHEPIVHSRMPPTAIFNQGESSPSNPSLDRQLDRTDKQIHQRLTSPNLLVDAAFSERSLPHVGNLDDDTDLFNMLTEDTVMGDHDSSTFDIWSTALDKPVGDSSPQQIVGQPGNASGVLTHLATGDMSIMSREPRVPSRTQRPRTDLMIPTTHEKRHMNGSTSSPRRSAPQNSTPTLRKLGDSNASQDLSALMQKLMQLGSIMYELQSKYCPENHGGRAMNISLDTFPIELVGKVLQVAMDFLEILRGFFFTQESPSRSDSASSLLRRRGTSISDFSDADDRAYHRYQLSPSPTSRPFSAYTPSSSASDYSTRRVSAAAKPATLQLISNYLNLLQLYLLLYNSVYDYTRATDSDFRQSQPIWNDLSIGDAPLYGFADIQIKLVLQVAARLLEEIEAGLGLTEGCRVSKKAAGEGVGILGMNVTAHFVEMCMSEVKTGPEPGRGMVTRVREIMGTLMGMLEAPICF